MGGLESKKSARRGASDFHQAMAKRGAQAGEKQAPRENLRAPFRTGLPGDQAHPEMAGTTPRARPDRGFLQRPRSVLTLKTFNRGRSVLCSVCALSDAI